MSQPILTSTIYDGAFVRAFWKYPGLPPSSFTLQTAPTTGSNPPYTKKNIGNNFGTVPITAPLSGPYQVRVAAIVDSSPVWSQGMLLLTTLPELVIARYDGKSVAVSWKPIPDAQPAISSWTVKVYIPTGGGETYSIKVDDPEATSAILPIAKPLKSLSASENYAVQVCANTSYGASTCLAPVTLNTALPLLSTAIYNGTGIQVFWTDQGTQQEPIIGFQVAVLDSNGNTVLDFQKKDSPPISYTLEVPVPLPPNETFYVQVSNYTATNIYTSTEPTQFETALPVVTKALLEMLSNKLTLQVDLDAIAFPTIAIGTYSLIVSSPSVGQPYTTSLKGTHPTSGNVDLSKNWDPKNMYTLQVVATSVDGIIQARSAPLTLLTAVPTISSGQYDGKSITANWSGPSTSSLPATAYQMSVLDSTKKAIYSTIINDPNSSKGKIDIPSPLLETANYFLKVMALSDTEAQAATAEISVLGALPKISDYKITTSSIDIFWDKIPDSFVPIKFLTLALVNKEGEIIFSKSKVDPNLSKDTLVFPSLPDISIDLYAAIIADNSKNSTSISELVKVNIIDWAPEITQIAFSNNVAIIEVNINPSSKESITGFEVDLYANGKFSDTTPINKFGTPLMLPLNPKSGVNYAAKVKAISDGHSISLESDENIILTSTGAIKTANYDGKVLTATWEQLSSPGINGYLISVLNGKETVASVYSSNSQAAIEVPLDLESPYSVVLQAIGNNAISQMSTPLAIVTNPTEILSSSYNRSTKKLEVTFKAVAQATLYNAQLYQGQKLVNVTPTYSGQKATFDITLDPQSSYQAVVTTANGPATGPESQRANIICSAPLITLVSNTNGTIKMDWTSILDENISGYLVTLFNKSGAIATSKANYTGTNSITIGKALTGDAPFSAQVQAISDTSVGPLSIPATIIGDGLKINALSYDGKSVTGHWTNSTEAGVTGYLMTVRDGNSIIAQVASAGSSATVEALLDPGKSYTLEVQPTGVNSLGPVIGGPNIFTTPTQIKSIVYDNIANTLTVGWNPVTGATTYVAKLYQDDIEVDITPTYHDNGAVFAGALDEWATYQVIVTPVAEIATGPPSLPANAIVAAPKINAVQNINNQVTIDWTPLIEESISGYLVTIFNKSGAIATTETNYTETTSIVLNNPLAGDAPYTAQVQAVSDKGTGPFSKAATIIGGGLKINTLSYDGKSVIGHWTNSTEAGVTGYLMTVRDGNSIIVQVASAGSSATVEALLDPGKSYTLDVQPTGVNSLGPVIGGPNIFTSKTQIKSVVYDDKAKTLTIEWNPVTGATSYVAKLYQNDIEVDITPTYHGNGAVFAGALDEWATYQVIVTPVAEIATGPPSLPANAIVAAPKINSVQNINNQVTIDWTPLIEESISGYLVTLFNKSGALATTEANYTETTSIVLNNQLTGDAPYTAQVQAVSDKGTGPFSKAATIIGGGLKINTLSYDGKSVTGHWTNSLEAGVTGYLMTVRDGNSIIAQVASAGSSATVEALLDPAKSYTLDVQPIGVNSLGPVMKGPKIFTTPTQIKSAVYDNISNTLTVEWDPFANATSFSAKLYADDIEVNITPTYDTNKAIFEGKLISWKNYHVIVKAIMTIATGPPSYPADVITAGPLITKVTNVENTVSVEWDELVGCNYSGYLVVLTNTKTSEGKTYYTEGRSFSVSNVVTGTDSWKVQVQAINNKAKGPYNKNVAYRDIITQKVTITEAKYDAQSLIVSWDGLPNPVNGYYLNIYNSYAMIHSTISSGTKMAIPVALDPNESYTALMQAAGENSIGPLGDSVQLIANSPVIQSITYDNNQLLTVTWADAGSASSFALHLYNEDIEITKFSPDYTGKTSGSGTIALDQTKVYNVRVQGIKGKVTGPLSAPELVISAAPKLATSSYQSGHVLASWNGINQEVVNGYNIGVFIAGKNKVIAQNAVPVTEGTVATALTEGTNYEVKVQAIGNKTTGPWSPPMNPWNIDSGYYFSEYKDDVQPYLFRAQSVPPSPNFSFELYLPQIFNKQPDSLPPGLTTSVNPNSPFVMSVNKGDKMLPYKISVSKKATNDAWNFAPNGPSIRTELSDDYDAFITAISGVDKGMLPGTIPYLNQVIARGLPLTYAETLYYAYGFNPSKRYVSLQAGMRITLSYSEYQFLGPGGTSPLLNGYVGSGSVSYVMGSYLSGSSQATQKLDIGFNNFLNQLALETHSNVGGGSSVLDTYITGASEPYYRIFYPGSFLSADAPGSVDPRQNISIVVASDFAKMKAATDAWNNGQPFSGEVLVLFLRGRATIVPEIKITLSGQEQWVPVGTTLRNVLDEFAAVPFRPTTGSADGWQTTNIQLTRTVDSVINKTTEVETAYSVGRNNPIAISHAKIVCYSNGQDNFDLPLMQGDTINLIKQN
ncbi:MAG: fibronectin type III domain-containing protein [Bacteroidota bacterium]